MYPREDSLTVWVPGVLSEEPTAGNYTHSSSQKDCSVCGESLAAPTALQLIYYSCSDVFCLIIFFKLPDFIF